jgi:DNA-binding XRE family transcriptional regulator
MRKVKCFPLCSIFQSFYLFLSEISSILRSKKTALLPSAEKILRELGENIRLGRKRRRLSLQQVAERADIARSTLGLIEKGSPGVAMSAYLQVLFVLGLEKDLRQVAADDPLGRKLQDAGLLSGRKK